jgi:hypothetical protein
MFEEFSAGYYLGQLYVEPRDGERAVVHEEHHERANETVYANGEGVERLDHPLVMKLDSTHFPVHRADDVPAGTLAVPGDLLEATGVEDPPALREVLLAKADQASRLMRWFGADPGGDSVVSL